MATPHQVRMISAAINRVSQQIGEDPDSYKREMILFISSGRTESRKEITYQEADTLIRMLNAKKSTAFRNNYDPADKCRKTIMYYAFMMGVINDRMSNGEKIASINSFIDNHSKIGDKRKLNDYDLVGLRKLVYQFEIFYKHYIKKQADEFRADSKP